MGAAERLSPLERTPAEEAAAAAARLKEKQLSETRKSRKEAESAHQAMLNRISFLKSEESKLDRDIENAKRRALELLTRKGEKAEKANDEDIAATAKDILGVMGPVESSSSRPLRVTTGRSSMQEGLAAAASASAKLRSTSAQRTARTSPASQPLKPTLSGGSRRPFSDATSKSTSASGASPSKPPASRKAALVGSSPYASGSPSKPLPVKPHGMEVLQRGSDGGGQPTPSAPRGGSGGGGGSLNTMDVLSDRRQGGPDQELIEELMAAGCSSSHAVGPAEHLQGLQQFSTDDAVGSKVVHVRATTLKKSDSTKAVLASGVGWGLSGGAGAHSPAPLIADKKESKQLQQELVKKRQLRGVRTAFGLPATVLQDQTASVVEIGAGTWS